MRKIITSVLLCGIILMGMARPAYAESYMLSDDYWCYEDQDFGTNYEVLLDDKAGLLTEDEIEELLSLMYYEGLQFGNMVFMTTDDAMGCTASDYQWYLYDYYYGEYSDGVAFLIDMDNRKLWMQGYGELSDKIDVDTANTITDNIYKMATNEEYGKCAMEGYRQIIMALGGMKVTGPLKYLGNACIAIIASLVATFAFAFSMSVSRKAADKEILDNIAKSISMTNPGVKTSFIERIYDPPSSSSDSSGGGGGGGGGGGHGF